MTDTNSFQDDRLGAGDISGIAGHLTGRIAKDRLTDVPQPPTKIAGEEDYAALKPGTTFIDPEGKTRKKAYQVTDETDYTAVPEGEQYLDPEGTLRLKPKYEGVDITAQTLYDMSVNDKERKKALERSYPGKVKQKGDEFYVEDEGGVLRKPGRGGAATAGFIASQVAPVGAAIGGSIIGAGAGSAFPGPGTVAGGIGGAGVGSAIGQSFNDAILQLAGVYDRSGGEEAANLGEAATFGAVGEGLGRGVAAAYPFVKGKIQNALPAMAAHFVGADKAGLEQAINLSDKGVLVPPSGWAKEAPHIQNVVEVFDPAFHTQKPLLESATEHYEKGATNIAESVGAKPTGKFSDPEAAVSTEKAGETILGRTREESRLADEKLRQALESRRTQLAGTQTATAEAHQAQISALRQAEIESRKAAEAVIQEGFAHIQGDIDAAMKTAKAGGNSGDLWWSVGEKLKAVKQGISARASKMYGEADKLAEGHLPNSEGLAETAADFLGQLPEGFEGRYPSIAKQLRDLAGVEDPKNPGQWLKEPVHPTFGQLHELRSIIRQNINYHDLTPGIREGVYKFFAKKVDDILHEPLKNAVGSSAVDSVTARVQRAYSDAIAAQGGGKNRIVNASDLAKRAGLSPEEFDRWYTTLDSSLGDAAGGKPPKIQHMSSTYSKDANAQKNILKAGSRSYYGFVFEPGVGADTRQMALADAARQLDLADAFYRENMAPLTDKNIQAVVSGLESGMPADPKNLFNTLVKEGRSDLTNKVKELVGPNLWAGVKAADVQDMLDQAKTLVPGQIDGKRFAQQVVDRVRSGMLDAVHGKEASAKLVEQAQRIAMLEGKLDLAIRPGDTVSAIIGKARAAEEAAKAAAKTDPLKTLANEMKSISKAREAGIVSRQLKATRANDPLAFLYDMTVGASEAVDRILGSEDLILAAAGKFGAESPEFNGLRQVWVQRILQNTMEPSGKLAKVSEEVQRIMFPGVSLDQMKTLAKEMDFLMASRGVRTTASSMVAVSKVEHPWASIPGGKLAGKILPGFDAGGRAMLGSYYKMVRTLSNNPGLLRWIEKGLKGDPVAKERSRQVVQRAMQMGGAVGAGAGESMEQVSNAPGAGPLPQ